MIVLKPRTLVLVLGLLMLGTMPAPAQPQTKPPQPDETPDGQLRHLVPEDWWVSMPAMVRVHLRDWGDNPVFSLDPDEAAAQLDALRAKGFAVLEVFAPFEGGLSFHGLDAVNRYRIQPEAGTVADFRRVVRMAHTKGMPVIAFDNLGYSSIDAVDFLKAADDVRAGRASREAQFYFWSDSADAPPPGHAPGDTYFMVRPTHLPGGEPGTFYESEKHEYWVYSERAGTYFWSKWGGVDGEGEPARLPQYNWGSEAFQEEAERVVRFWMDTGIDGMIIDAVNWYIDYTWAIGRERITEVIESYGNAYIQPEGAGGFHEDPVPWITDGGWNSVQDYGLGIWWEEGTNVVANAIESGDPRPIEPALRRYHDRVVAAGGVNYFEPPAFEDPAKEHLSIATIAFIGDLLYVSHERALASGDEVTWILETKRRHPALHNLSTRRVLPTDADDKVYAFLQTAADASERVLVVLNFQPTAQTVEVDLSGVAASRLTDLRTAAQVPRTTRMKVDLPPYGYRLFAVD